MRTKLHNTNLSAIMFVSFFFFLFLQSSVTVYRYVVSYAFPQVEFHRACVVVVVVVSDAWNESS